MNSLADHGVRSVEDFRIMLNRECHGVDCLLDHGGPRGPLGRSHRGIVHPLSNRFCINPVLAGDGLPTGLPSEATHVRWRGYGAGGAAITWSGELVAIDGDGACHAGQLRIDAGEDPAEWLRTLRGLHHQGAAEYPSSPAHRLVGIELSHAGPFATSDHRRIAISPPRRTGAYQASDDDLSRIRDDFIRGAGRVAAAGFDFVAIDVAHGHLLHDGLSAYDRAGRYGGDLTNRSRLIREIVEGIRAEFPSLEVGVHLSITDPPRLPGVETINPTVDRPAHRFGMSRQYPDRADLLEPFGLIAFLQVLGVRLFNISVGSPHTSPQLYAPGRPDRSGKTGERTHPLVFVQRNLESTRACKQRFPDLIIMGGGYSWLRAYLPHVAAMEIDDGHADFVGLGRMSRTYGDLPRDVLQGGTVDETRLMPHP